MTNYYVVHKDGNTELYATVTDDSKRILHVTEEAFREQIVLISSISPL